jgi:hypothetical protein
VLFSPLENHHLAAAFKLMRHLGLLYAHAAYTSTAFALCAPAAVYFRIVAARWRTTTWLLPSIKHATCTYFMRTLLTPFCCVAVCAPLLLSTVTARWRTTTWLLPSN